LRGRESTEETILQAEKLAFYKTLHGAQVGSCQFRGMALQFHEIVEGIRSVECSES